MPERVRRADSQTDSAILTKNVTTGFDRHSMPPPAQVQHWAKTAEIDRVTLRYWPLTLEVTGTVADVGRRPPSVYQVWSS